MYTPVDQNAIDQKIHSFMARKSPWKTFSKTVAEHLKPETEPEKSTDSDISYEQTKWHQTDSVFRSRWQKAH